MFSKKDKAFNPSASEGLTLYPAVRHFLWSLKLHASRDHHVRSVAYSLFCLLDLLDLLHQSMRRAIESAALERLTRVHLEAFISAHGKQNTLPKHHFTRHLSDCFAKQRWLLNCFCLERKHKTIKRYANNLHTITSHWSKTVLQDAVLTDLQGLEETARRDYSCIFRRFWRCECWKPEDWQCCRGSHGHMQERRHYLFRCWW